MATTTNPILAPRYTLIGIVVFVAAISILLAIVVSSSQRAERIAKLRAPGALREGRRLLVAYAALNNGVPRRFVDVEGPAFLDVHFECRPGATMQELSKGMPAVVVRPRSQYLLEDPSTVRELANLNAEVTRFCRSMQKQ